MKLTMLTARAYLLFLTAIIPLIAAETKPVDELKPPKDAPDRQQQVQAKDYSVVKDDKIDNNDEETSVANDIQTIVITSKGGPGRITDPERIKIVSKTFTPPSGWLFSLFPNPTWYGAATHVDILRDPAVFGYRLKDSDVEIKIKGYFVLTDAADFPLRGEGNLKRPASTGGTGGSGGSSGYSTPTAKHWSAKVSTIELDIRTDFNRDRKIDWNDPMDLSTKERPFRFWINDDADYGDANNGEAYPDIKGNRYITFPKGPAGKALTNFGIEGGDGRISPERVDGNKDLLDFMPVAIRVKNLAETKQIAEGRTLGFRIRCKDDRVVFKLTWWDYDPIKSGDFQIKELKTGFAASLSEAPAFARVYEVTKEGLVIPPEPLKRLLETGQLMFICEGGYDTKIPIEFVAYLDGNEATKTELPISTSTPEDMYRWINVRGGVYGYENGSQTTETEVMKTKTTEPPNFPDSYLKDEFLVFAHGFRTSEIEGRGNCAEMFKRFFWSGANTKYIGMAWFGNNGGLDYYMNAQNAILSAERAHASLIAVAAARKTHFSAHSLGNMLLSSVIQDYKYYPKSYAMFNSALSQEVLTENGQPSRETNGDNSDAFINAIMVHPSWRTYKKDIRANEWHNLFDAGDSRSKLTWKGKFSSGLAKVGKKINLYSLTDEVLDNWRNIDDINDAVNEIAVDGRNFIWYSGQINMGRWYLTSILQASKAGWGFRSNSWDFPLYPSNQEQLDLMKITPVFRDFRHHETIVDKSAVIKGKVGSQWQLATTLCESIPATTFAVGRNSCNDLKVFEKHFDLNKEISLRPKVSASSHNEKIIHSSILYIGYLMINPVIDLAVKEMELK